MTDLLNEFSDIDIVDSAVHFLGDAAARLDLAINPLTDEDTAGGSIRLAAHTIRSVAEALEVLQQRWAQPPSVIDVVLRAAADHYAGKIDADDFTHVCTTAAFQLEGVEPTEQQYSQRLSEFRLMDAFMGRVDEP